MNALAVSVPRERWSNWHRPLISIELLALLVSVFFAAFCNRAFWSAFAAVNTTPESSGWLTAGLLFVAMVCLNLMLLCLVLNRWTAKPVLTVLLLVTALAVYYVNQYNVYLDPDMIRNVLHSEPKESAELITPGLILPLLLYAVLPIGLVWTVRLKRRPLLAALWRRVVVILAALLLCVGCVLLSFQDVSAFMRNHKEARHLITPGNFLVSLARVASADATLAEQPRRIVGADAIEVGRSAKPRLLVVVIGETVRAQNWGLNGYARQTTPELSQLDVFNFSDVTACGTSTEVSLPCMFSAQGRRNYDKQEIKRSQSLLHVLQRAGIETLWRDNQTGCKGVCEGLAFESFLHADDPDFCDGKRCFDEVLLSGLPSWIDAHPGDQVVVLHQLGNHGPSYFSRYPASFKRFMPACETPQLGDCTSAEIVNAYDNAILYTDHFVAETIHLLQAQDNRDTALIYVSDHGESLGENNLYLHGVPYPIAPKEQLKVPMLAWLSPAWVADQGIDVSCLRSTLNNPASHDNLFSTVLGLLQVQTVAYDQRQDLFAGCRSGASAASNPVT